MFDKVCVIYEGRMAYFGPADQAKQYFVNMGYEPANRQTIADFLVAVTDPEGRIPREDVKIIPRTAEEFAEYFRRSTLGQANKADMDSYRAEYVGRPERAATYRESVVAEHSRLVRDQSPYTVNILTQACAGMVRRLQIKRGNLTAQAVLTG
jgi:ATP-binding cassette subfamily G (WHITE) protein 2 (SNQ2)